MPCAHRRGRPRIHSLEGQHQDVDRTQHGRVSQNGRGQTEMENVRSWCGSRTAEEQNKTDCAVVSTYRPTPLTHPNPNPNPNPNHNSNPSRDHRVKACQRSTTARTVWISPPTLVDGWSIDRHTDTQTEDACEAHTHATLQNNVIHHSIPNSGLLISLIQKTCQNFENLLHIPFNSKTVTVITENKDRPSTMKCIKSLARARPATAYFIT